MEEQGDNEPVASLGSVLLVDDEEIFLYATGELLKRSGYDCLCVTNVGQAINALQSRTFDVLISDICMPGNDDLRLARAVDNLAPGLPLLVVTGYPSVETAVESFSVRAKAYLVKPIDYDILLKAVKSCVDCSKLIRSVMTMERKLEEWSVQLLDMKNALSLGLGSHSRISAQDYLTICLNHIHEAFLNLVNLSDSSMTPAARTNVCQLFECPRLEKRDELISKAIDVLDATKQSFKSKALGELRRELENFVQFPKKNHVDR